MFEMYLYTHVWMLQRLKTLKQGVLCISQDVSKSCFAKIRGTRIGGTNAYTLDGCGGKNGGPVCTNYGSAR